MATGSPWTQCWNRLQQQLHEYGLTQINERWTYDFSKSMNPALKYADEQIGQARPLRLAQLAGAFQLYVIGVACACEVFVLEHCALWAIGFWWANQKIV